MDAIEISVSRKALMLNSEVMMKIDSKGHFPVGETGEGQHAIKPLQEFLWPEYQKKKGFYKGVGKNGPIIFQI